MLCILFYIAIYRTYCVFYTSSCRGSVCCKTRNVVLLLIPLHLQYCTVDPTHHTTLAARKERAIYSNRLCYGVFRAMSCHAMSSPTSPKTNSVSFLPTSPTTRWDPWMMIQWCPHSLPSLSPSPNSINSTQLRSNQLDPQYHLPLPLPLPSKTNNVSYRIVLYPHYYCRLRVWNIT